MVCRQVVEDLHNAEDAFQATFLVLLRRGGSLRVRDRDSLGPWLHGVAFRICLNARRSVRRRRLRERRVAVMEASPDDVSLAAARDDSSLILHQEVNRLPAKYRDPVVLCYFEGRTHDEAAAALSWPVGTVRGRLARARDRLRTRLTQRGFRPETLLEATFPGFAACGELSAALRNSALSVIHSVPSGRVALLANLLSRSWFATRLKWTVGVILIPPLIATGASLVEQRERASATPRQVPPPAETVVAVRRLPNPMVRRDDAMPRYARARLGTLGFLGPDGFNRMLHTSDGKYLVSWDQAGMTRIWDAASGRIVRKLANPTGEGAITPDGTTLAYLDDEKGLRLEDLVTGRELRRWHRIPGESYEKLTFAPDGRTLAASTKKGDRPDDPEFFITLWDTKSPTEFRRRLQGDWYGLMNLEFSADGKDLIVVSDDWNPPAGGFPVAAPMRCFVRIYDLATGRERKRFPLDGVPGHPLAFTRNRALMAVTDSEMRIRMIEVATGRERGPKLAHHRDPRDPKRTLDDLTISEAPRDMLSWLEFSPDGSILASGSFRARNRPIIAAPSISGTWRGAWNCVIFPRTPTSSGRCHSAPTAGPSPQSGSTSERSACGMWTRAERHSPDRATNRESCRWRSHPTERASIRAEPTERFASGTQLPVARSASSPGSIYRHSGWRYPPMARNCSWAGTRASRSGAWPSGGRSAG